ncbi:hypothetical protein GUJ93_ZPchr0001g31425 [Zizania palustris]|uniref:Uncharacterized protein n=1 Tax=Zizania palustris TaxID=103762 RepID=A0A8J5RS80_ZIZPA|nr:hypothetical protein GUJ93_ZPchr0001g31425 [Zizania palustris]
MRRRNSSARRGSRRDGSTIGADWARAIGRGDGAVPTKGLREEEDEQCGVIWVFAKNSALRVGPNGFSE